MARTENTTSPRTDCGVASQPSDDGRYAPRRLTVAQNVRLTIKVLAVAGLMIGSLWGLSLWTAAE